MQINVCDFCRKEVNVNNKRFELDGRIFLFEIKEVVAHEGRRGVRADKDIDYCEKCFVRAIEALIINSKPLKEELKEE